MKEKVYNQLAKDMACEPKDVGQILADKVSKNES